MTTILFVRIRSELPFDELERRMIARMPRFRDVPGLTQKFYGRDPASGDVCGIYLFDSAQALADFRDTELAQSIPAAYEATEIRREVFELLCPLFPERGTVAG